MRIYRWLRKITTKSDRVRLDLLRLALIPGLCLGMVLSFLAIALWWKPQTQRIQALPVSINEQLAEAKAAQAKQVARLTAVRILDAETSGSGVIVERQGDIYTVLTNWHVVDFGEEHIIMTADGERHQLIDSPRQLGELDMAIARFQSTADYEVAEISVRLVVGERVYAAGFPMYDKDTLSKTLELGLEVFKVTQGKVSLLPAKSLDSGYRLGYTNDIEIGMSGGPIFNGKGLLVGINGRTKYRDPAFGVYTFADGSEPPEAILEQMVSSSWGIPIRSYLQLVSQDLTEVQP
jgi:S1-C subfamily serine protease